MYDGAYRNIGKPNITKRFVNYCTEWTFGIIGLPGSSSCPLLIRSGDSTSGSTDYLRKAIGKKKADLMATLKADFIAGAVGNGCPGL